jgi:peptidoglycan/xylan/chitin deacetylase (PgdA/CDA1 family)/phage anti-repressor protein
MNFRVKVSAAALILLFYLAFSGFSPTGGYGQVSVKIWADDRKSAFSFTFDDAYMSQYIYVMPILDSFRFKGTFFLNTIFITDDSLDHNGYGTWNQFQKMALDGHEMGSHTVTHPDLDTLPIGTTSTAGTLLYELYQSQKTIEQEIPNQKCITFAYPFLAYDSTVISYTAQFYESARDGSNDPNGSYLIGSEFYNIGAYKESFDAPRDSTRDDLKLQDFESYVQTSITDGKWGILEGHDVVPFAQILDMSVSYQASDNPISTEWLTSLCQWLKQKSDSNLVWVETFGNITRYMKEREQFQYNITLQTATQIKINATDTLNNQIYNYPLTVDISVPSTWEWAIIIQGSRTDTIKTLIAGDSAYVRTYVIPDGGILILNKTDPPMPVELTSFTAAVINKDVHLNWKTSTEINNNRFDVERMMENKPWEGIGSLPGAGNSNSPKAYSFIDNSSLSKGKYSYRLKQIDNDGHYKYSSNVEVEITFAPSSYSLDQNYPNPFNPSTRIKYSIPFESNVKVIVFNALGEVVKELTNEMKGAGTYEVSFISLGISSGVYFYSIVANSTDGKQSFRETKKMLLLK